MISLGVLILLLIAYLSILFFGRLIGTYGSIATALIGFSLSWIFLIIGWNGLELLSVSDLWSWVFIGSENEIPFSVRFDEYTFGMYLVVLTVSFLVHMYSVVYMYADPFLSRFISYLTLFTLFMLILVSADNFVVLFLGWEGVGVCSYLLISFWYTRVQAAKAATKAFIINKVGDVFLLLGISVVFSMAGSADFSSSFSILSYSGSLVAGALVGCLFIGVVGKSAQIGLHTWLPDAMEGPTPVSALIHAATMVTAGVFLMVRSSPFFEFSPEFLFTVAAWGAFTALFSGVIGLAQNDIKKVIAYSTCSQLGFMVVACGFSYYSLAFFHLFNHAFFKAMLFLSAGSVIHILLGEQDTRKMGGLISFSPLIYTYVSIGSFSLMGFSFLSGFYSKDTIIEIAATQLVFGSGLLFWVVIMAALLTSLYSTKLLFNTFTFMHSGLKRTIYAEQKLTALEAIILGALCLGGVISGYLFRDMFTGFGASLFDLTSLVSGGYVAGIEPEIISFIIKVLPLVGSFIITIAYIIPYSQQTYAMLNASILEAYRFYYNEVINKYIAMPLLIFARHNFEQLEKGILENYGPIMIIRMTSVTVNKNGAST